MLKIQIIDYLREGDTGYWVNGNYYHTIRITFSKSPLPVHSDEEGKHGSLSSDTYVINVEAYRFLEPYVGGFYGPFFLTDENLKYLEEQYGIKKENIFNIEKTLWRKREFIRTRVETDIPVKDTYSSNTWKIERITK